MMNGHRFVNARQRFSATGTNPFLPREDQITVNHPQSTLGEQLTESWPTVIFGISLVFLGAVIIFWNEGQAVEMSRCLDEGFNSVVSIPSSSYILDENDGKLVNVWGTISVSTPLQDEFYGIRVKSVKLKRRVQIYQWMEEESNLSPNEPDTTEDTTYSYSQVWKDKLIDSSAFYIPWGHENPKSIPVPSFIHISDSVHIGAYNLSSSVKDTFTQFIPFSGDALPEQSDLKLHNGMYYDTQDIFNPNIGDIRIQFYYAGHDGEMVTIIGAQQLRTIYPYIASSGKELLITRPGKLTPQEMFSSEHAQSRLFTWLTRIAGWFAIFIGMAFISSIIHYLVLLSPLLREVVFLGIGSANLTLSMSLSLILIGCAWCFYRPGLALCIVVGGALPLLRAIFSNRTQRSAPQRARSQGSSPDSV